MKVVAILGSPRAKGNCAESLNIMGRIFEAEGIELEVVHVGAEVIRGCVGCRGCQKAQNERCVFDDAVNSAVAKMKDADGIVLTSPVYFSGIAGTMKSFLDRAFYVSAANGGMFRGKVAGAVVSVRRTGGSHTLDGLNHYLTYGEMVLATSTYWNVVHGRDEGEMVADLEAVQSVEMLARNMAWLIKMKATSNLPQPPAEPKVMTSFIK